MSTLETLADSTRNGSKLVWLALAFGIALVAYGSYIHVTIGRRTLGHCDACDPWHPLWVVTPLVLGSVFVLLAGYLAVRR